MRREASENLSPPTFASLSSTTLSHFEKKFEITSGLLLWARGISCNLGRLEAIFCELYLTVDVGKIVNLRISLLFFIEREFYVISFGRMGMVILILIVMDFYSVQRIWFIHLKIRLIQNLLQIHWWNFGLWNCHMWFLEFLL